MIETNSMSDVAPVPDAIGIGGKVQILYPDTV